MFPYCAGGSGAACMSPRQRAGPIRPDRYHCTVPCASPGTRQGKGDFMAGFSLQTLGFPEINSDDGPIKLNLRKGLALLIYLAEARGTVARDVIATLLWPESPRETARARLRRMLHSIEAALGQPVFETARASVRLAPATGLTVDSHLFEHA